MYFKNAAVTNFRRSVTKTFMVPLTSLKPQNDYKFVRGYKIPCAKSLSIVTHGKSK